MNVEFSADWRSKAIERISFTTSCARLSVTPWSYILRGAAASRLCVFSTQAAFLLQRCFCQPCLSTYSFTLIIPIDNKMFHVILLEV